MITTLHVADPDSQWDHRVALGQLLAGQPADDDQVRSAWLGPGPVPPAWRDLIVSSPLGSGLTGLLALRRGIRAHQPQLVHAWSVRAAKAARSAVDRGTPIAVSVFDPGLAPRAVRMLRALTREGPLGVICGSQRVHRRLVEQGVPVEQCVVVRPAVDFGRIRTCDVASLRAQLQLPSDGWLILSDEPPGWDAGHPAVIWAALMRWQLDPSVRLVVPGRSSDLARLERLAAVSAAPEAVVFTHDAYPFEDLCAAADLLVLANGGECTPGAVAWCMAAGTPIIAPATYATTEMLAHGLNAVLYKLGQAWRRTSVQLCQFLDGRLDHAREVEVARGQAYEVFSLRRMVRQMVTVHENLLAGRPVATEVDDPAVVSG